MNSNSSILQLPMAPFCLDRVGECLLLSVGMVSKIPRVVRPIDHTYLCKCSIASSSVHSVGLNGKAYIDEWSIALNPKCKLGLCDPTIYIMIGDARRERSVQHMRETLAFVKTFRGVQLSSAILRTCTCGLRLQSAPIQRHTRTPAGPRAGAPFGVPNAA